MATVKQYVGVCPTCGDELYIFKTRSRKRFIKCINDHCEYNGYGIPKSGSLEVTGLICPKYNVPVLAVLKYLKLPRGRFKRDPKKSYFFTKRPCFTCFEQDKCEVLKEAKLDY